MPPPSSPQDLLDLVRKSGVTDEGRLDAQVQSLEKGGQLPDQPEKLAELLVNAGLLTKFQSEQLLQGKWRRFSIGKYKVLERLGSGGMGSVYLCEHKLMRRRVAVKVLPTAKAKDPSSLERFEREARVLAALDHPNLVHAYDSDQDGDLHFLVMEFVDGINLQEIIRKGGPLEMARAVNFIYQACQGLGFAHDMGLVHRDIKPGNLMVDRGGVVKVLDLGLARFFNDEEDILTRKYDENVLGTADYLAPEQAIDSHEVDIRADIYSLGATFYFLLTGHAPFEEGSVTQKLLAHQTKDPKPIANYRSDVPAELCAIIMKMMAKKREERFQHPLEISRALEPWVGHPIAPPSQVEIPELCPAASGAPATDAITAISPPHLAPGQIRTSGLNPSPAKAIPAVPVAPLPAKPQPREAVEITPRPVSPAQKTKAPVLPDFPGKTMVEFVAEKNPEESSPWEDLPSETEIANLENTVPEGTGNAIYYPSWARNQQTRSPWVSIILILVGLAFILAIGLGIWLFVINSSTMPTTENNVLRVGENLQGEGTFKSLALAFKMSKKGDVIEIWEDISEKINFDLGRIPSNLTLRAAPSKTIRWTHPKGETKDPLIILNGSSKSNFQIQGEGIILDGEGNLDYLMQFAYNCSGMKIENLTLRGFKTAGIHLFNCVGSPGRLVQFTGLKFDLTKSKTAFMFAGGKGAVTITHNDFIAIDNCDFQDVPPSMALQRTSEAVTGKNLQLPLGTGW